MTGMETKDTVKCKGCGCEIWVGAKMIDGYCHDCYSRGRHLPPIIEDPVQTQKKKKPVKKPTPAPATPTYTKPAKKKRFSNLRWAGRFTREIFRRFKWKAVLALLIVVGVLYGLVFVGLPALIGTFNRPQTADGTMKMLREAKFSTFKNEGERIPGDTLTANAEAITAEVGNGSSYRASGFFEYAFYDYINDYGKQKKARSDIEISYNYDLDVYKFKITNSGDTTETLEQFRIADGTYYIVTENDKTYVLHYGNGKRTATAINNAIDDGADRNIYDFLLSYCMKALVKTDFFTDASTVTWHLWDGDLYSLPISDVGDGLKVYDGLHRIELRTYQHKPIYWFDCNRDKEAMIEWQIKVDYYYDAIPLDAPSVADYQ